MQEINERIDAIIDDLDAVTGLRFQQLSVISRAVNLLNIVKETLEGVNNGSN